MRQKTLVGKPEEKAAMRKGNKIRNLMNMEITSWYSDCRIFWEHIICKRAEQKRIIWVSLMWTQGRNNLKDS